VLSVVGTSSEDAAKIIAQFPEGEYASLETIAGQQGQARRPTPCE
jgi:hypothetical protein